MIFLLDHTKVCDHQKAEVTRAGVMFANVQRNLQDLWIYSSEYMMYKKCPRVDDRIESDLLLSRTATSLGMRRYDLFQEKNHTLVGLTD